MKIKIGPIEVEQEPLNDEALFSEYKKSSKDVEKYLEEKSKFFDLTLRNLIAGKTIKLIRDFIFTIIGGFVFVGWSVYVFFTSKDAFIWNELNVETVIAVFLQSLLVIFICFLPIILVGGFIKIISIWGSKKGFNK